MRVRSFPSSASATPSWTRILDPAQQAAQVGIVLQRHVALGRVGRVAIDRHVGDAWPLADQPVAPLEVPFQAGEGGAGDGRGAGRVQRGAEQRAVQLPRGHEHSIAHDLRFQANQRFAPVELVGCVDG